MVELSFIENIQNVCRLCLRCEENMQDIFEFPNFDKIPLIERIFLYYQVKIAKEDGLPNKICKDCFDFTETFTSYHTSVQKCEAKLQALIWTAGALGTKIQHNKKPFNAATPANEVVTNTNSNSNYTEILPDEDCEVIVVDPNQEYDSSDESFSEGEYTPPTNRSTPQLVQISNNETISRTASPVIETINNINSYSNNTNSNNINNTISNNNNNNSNGNSNNGNINGSANDHDIETIDVELENRNAFLCQYCDMAFIGATECAEHERKHSEGFPYSCTFCQFKCADRQILINHVKDNHSDKPYICVVCNKGFGRRSDLKKHAIVHTGIRPFSCSVCTKSFSRNTNLTKHMRIHTGLKPFVCQKCPRSFTTNADLERHQKVHECIDKPFKCQKCDASFNRKDKLQSHLKVHLKKEANDALNIRLNQSTDIGQISNLPPSNKTLNITNFENEMNVSNVGNGTIIIKDNSDFIQNDNIITSFDTSGGRTNYNQGSIINPNDYIQQHQQFQNIMQFPSHQQQQQLLMSSNQFQHSIGQQISDAQQIHHQLAMNSTIMPPPLPVQSSNNNVVNLQSQYKILPQQPQQLTKIKTEPETNKPKRAIHICSICAKVFTRKRELQRHVVIHSGQKPFACSFCGKRFNRKDKLLRHEKIHRDGKFPCPKCKLDFAKQETLDIHLQLHEKVERASQPPPPEPAEQAQPKVPNFLQSLQVGVTPQLNFYSDTI